MVTVWWLVNWEVFAEMRMSEAQTGLNGGRRSTIKNGPCYGLKLCEISIQILLLP
jgi:hypothetical protein